MSTENIKISKYILDLNRKLVNNFYDHINQKNKGLISHLTHDLINSTNLSIKEINFLIEFSELNNIIEITKTSYELTLDISRDKFFHDLCNFYFNSVYSNEDIYLNIFQSSKISLENDFIIINLDSINIFYTPVLTTLSKLGFIKYDNNYAYVKNFVFAKKLLERPLKKLKKSLDEFEKEQFERSERGKLAELFVLNSEINKLKDTPYNPIRISLEDVGKGYDIISFKENGQKFYIEVKSISNKRFFWSENEINVSKTLKDKYFIYLVSFKNNKPFKIEKLIQNPYDEIFIKEIYQKKNIEDYIVFL